MLLGGKTLVAIVEEDGSPKRLKIISSSIVQPYTTLGWRKISDVPNDYPINQAWEDFTKIETVDGRRRIEWKDTSEWPNFG